MLRRILSLFAVAVFILTAQAAYSQENTLLDARKRQIPVSYIENRGQWPAEVRFMAQLRGLNVWLTDKGVKYDVYSSRPATASEVQQEKVRLRKTSKAAAIKLNSQTTLRRSGQVIDMELLGASTSTLNGSEQEIGYRNYFIGNNPNKWQTNVPTFAKLNGKDIYPGIDVVYSFQEGKPRYDFIVKPNANPSAISLRFNGANSVSVSEDKGITLTTKLGNMYNGNIYAYQHSEGREVQIPCRFDIQGEVVKFAVGKYDTQKPLVIDPLVYSSYFGGSGNDEINGITLDNFGNVVIAGGTNSPNYPYSKGAYDTTIHGGMDAFVAKFDKTLTTLLYSTILGGGSDEKANAVAVGLANGIYICGETSSTNLPASGWNLTYAAGVDAFIAKISPDGKKIDYCTYAGGTKDDRALAIAVSPSEEACVVGESNSANFPVSTNAYQKTNKGLLDAIVIKLRPSGGSAAFSTYFGGSGDEHGYAVGSDITGSFLYAAGSTASGLPATYPVPPTMGQPGFPDADRVPYNRTFNSGNFTDGWVAKFNDAGAFTDYNNQYITYIGANKNDAVRSLTVLKDGSVLVAGETQGGPGNKADFPSTNSNTINKGGLDVFVSKLSSNGRMLPASTMFGGSGNESGVGVAISSSTSDVFVTGQTTSQDFQMSQLSPPLLPVQAALKGARDAFLVRLPAGLEKVAYATYLGGKGNDGATSVVTTPRGDAFIAGYSASDDLEVFQDEYQPATAGGQDGFISKIAFGALNLITPNGGGTFCPGGTVTIKWTKTDGLADADSIQINLSSNSGATWYKAITPKPITALTYDWKIPADQEPGTLYKIQLLHSSGIRTETSSDFTIGTPVQIFENPVGDSVCAGKRVRFRVKGIGNQLTYKWYRNNQPISGANADSLVIPSAQSGDAGTYKVEVSAGCTPATSEAVTLVVKPATKISTSLPATKTVSNGNPVSFQVAAQGKDLIYEWYLDGFKIPDATTNEYKIAKANSSDNGTYKVIVRGECGADSAQSVLDVMTAVNEEPGNPQGTIVTLLSKSPVSDELTLDVTSHTGCSVSISLTDNLGRDIMNIFNGTIEAAQSKSVTANVKNLATGIYWITAKCGTERAILKVDIVK
jgi:hypothetical protein